MSVVEALLSIALAVSKALANGDTKRVSEILDGELQTTIVARAKELEAEAKFGPRAP
jgi:hypothetical protein